ncbi:MAG: hypothetical protein FJ249_06985 [Nitrospira sp.]|nr:hypothetical protein [Nitrospira sp.]
MIKALYPCVFLLCLACAGPAFSTRSVHSDQTWLVRLDTYADPGKAAEVRHDHPAEWTEAELSAILSRLLLQERVGLLEKKPPPRPVFSADEVSQLTPKLRQAFRTARPTEWIVFCVIRSTGTAQEVTSGGFFIQERHLHVIVANHREPLSSGRDGTEAVQANPLQALKRTGRTLTFDPPMYALASPENWMGGYAGAPASELILDQTTFLEAARQPAVPLVPALAPVPPVQASSPPASIAPTTPVPSPSAQTSESVISGLKDQVLRLQEETERLKHKLEEQAGEIARLKARLAESEGAQRKRLPKKPTR